MRKLATAAILSALVVLMAGCADPPGEMPSLGPLSTVDGEPFDQQASDALLVEGRERAASDPDAAATLIRDAALNWPDNIEAWRRLAELERSRGNLAEAEAAEFMVERLRLFPSDRLYVQRQVNAALRTYLDEQAALPDHNPSIQVYGTRLTQFYDTQLAERPVYQPPSGIFNIAPNEIPTVILTIAIMGIYFVTLAGA